MTRQFQIVVIKIHVRLEKPATANHFSISDSKATTTTLESPTIFFKPINELLSLQVSTSFFIALLLRRIIILYNNNKFESLKYLGSLRELK